MRGRLGVTILVLGVFLLARNADIWPFNTSLWTVVFLGFGGAMLIGRVRERRYRETPFPITLIAIGTIFLLRDIGIVSGLFGFWPVVLIALGGYLMLGSIVDRDPPAAR